MGSELGSLKQLGETWGATQTTSQHIIMADAKTQRLMEDLGLKKKDIDAVNFAFDVYDFKGDGTIDAFHAGDVLRACNMNPTLAAISQGNDLFKLLTNLGEKLTKEEAKILMNELCEPEDEDGFMQFKPFLERMCAAEK